ncbi:2,3,4,5-tetrahydropyridine-2,6-dicarboxylate N-succinyltransferase [Rickettsiales endosymbiont of Stachyamoeba lipophora]|uniref:2,3,4,5-tetrahydropyridine-2,6-dicarboxylate N-succinyltransferase n=1 Tax=Rickettsiales endosymbiont of Stachyamoeba lipophora TaxID=2486578 RepID=UPI000F64C4CA|nr:2,3,4,5-tetrahydropyridine-2,6-dicarboxylate N-succinyltransferase [Rickettsiales endosymbiont of Stachyamoeba lipophora]
MLASKINKLWDKFQQKSLDADDLKQHSTINEVIEMLNLGEIRVAENNAGKWTVNEWVKKAILLYFAESDNQVMHSSLGNYYDKIALKFHEWEEQDFEEAGFRVVPGAIVRHGAYIAKKSVIMPSFINIGAYIDTGTMVDTWATVGSCAQIGKNCHISGGTGIGGVLEPLQANPVIIEDNCFIGARSEIAEGVIIGTGSVISMGVFIGASTKIINNMTGEITYGYVPPFSVVIPGVINEGNFTSKAAAIIIKTVDEKTRSKVSINELLRM